MKKIRAIFQELLRAPLFQFLAIGLLIFLFVSLRAPSEVGEEAGLPARAAVSAGAGSSIQVDRESLLAFVQRRTQQPNESETARTFALLDAAAKEIWIQRFVREEALVREAKALGLDREDEIIRRRLVQKIEFLTRGVIDEEVDQSDAALARFQDDRISEYRRPALFGFTHVFARASKAQTESARRQAAAWVDQFNQEGLSSEAALSRGDRFLYNRSYADRTLDEVESHFGEGFAASLLSFPVDGVRWKGPVESIHGWHVVLLTDRVEARIPTVNEIAPTLRADLLREARDRALEGAIAEVVSKYPVEVAEDVPRGDP